MVFYSPARNADPVKGFDPSRPLRRRSWGDREQFVRELLCGVPVKCAYEIAGFKRPAGNAQRLARAQSASASSAGLLALEDGRAGGAGAIPAPLSRDGVPRKDDW